MTGLADALREPLPLAPNRIPRFYRGGLMLDRFRRAPDPADDDRPEDWVGSATRTWSPPGTRRSALGTSRVDVGGATTSLEDLLRREPDALVGRELVERAGPTLGVLVKLLDAGQRLPVHCHPSRPDAASLLGSRFGKTEAWLILATRDDEPARVWVGFGEPISRERLRDWIERQETDAMLGALVEHPVHAGEVLLVPAGTPHAIGPGVFLLELQEPTDFSIVAETAGFPVDPASASLGLGWDRALGCFDTDATADPHQVPTPAAPDVIRLLGPTADPYFRAFRQRVDGDARPPFDPAFAIGVVVAGAGSVDGNGTSLTVTAGDTFALAAAAVAGSRIRGRDLQVVWCLGPDPSALDRAPLPAPA